jgi:hypothetical protein
MPPEQPAQRSTVSPFGEVRAPAEPPDRLHRLRGPGVTAAVVGALTVAIHLRDPHDAGSWGGCPWLTLTGRYCPGCGGLRAVNDLTNGDLLGAASANLLFVAMVPLLVTGWLLWTRRAWTGGAAPARPHAMVWIGLATVVMVLFAVLRNLPFGSWLAP